MEKSDEETADDKRIAALMEESERATAAGDIRRAEELAAEILASVAERADEKPSPWLVLVTQAAAHEDQQEWAEAEKCYREALAVALLDSSDMAWKAHGDLAGFFSLMGRSEEALAEARLAKEAGRQSMSLIRLMCLDSLAGYESGAGNWSRARELIDEIFRHPDIEDGSRSRVRARALTERACCHIHEEDAVRAQEDLDDAWRILEPLQTPSMMAGHHGAIARWWAVRSRLFGLQSEVDGELDAYGRAVEHRRLVASARQVKRSIRLSGLLRYLERYGELLRRGGRNAEAEDIETECSDLRVMLFGPTKAPPQSAASACSADVERDEATN